MALQSDAGLSTRCPQCGTILALQDHQLRQAAGWVRCSQCEHSFSAAEHSLPRLQPADSRAHGAGDAGDEPDTAMPDLGLDGHARPFAAGPAPVMPQWLAGLSLDLDDEPQATSAAGSAQTTAAAQAPATAPATSPAAEEALPVARAKASASFASSTSSTRPLPAAAERTPGLAMPAQPESAAPPKDIPLLKARASAVLPEAVPQHGAARPASAAPSAAAVPAAARRAPRSRAVLLAVLVLAVLLLVLACALWFSSTVHAQPLQSGTETVPSLAGPAVAAHIRHTIA